MSKTYRNRKALSKDLKKSDNGKVFQSEVGEIDNGALTPYRKNFFSKEAKSFRKAHYRSYRSSVRQKMAHEDWENIPAFCRTSGWLTW